MMTQAKQRAKVSFLVVVEEDPSKGAEYSVLEDTSLPLLVAGTKLMCQYLQLSLVQKVIPCQSSTRLVLWQE